MTCDHRHTFEEYQRGAIIRRCINCGATVRPLNLPRVSVATVKSLREKWQAGGVK